jgi:glutamyl-tRNA synthetase
MIVSRFAPSPSLSTFTNASGELETKPSAPHIGNARTCLFSYLHAKKHGGRFTLRIENTNFSQSSEESIKLIFDTLDWLGIKSDLPVIYQSERKAIYQEYIDKLLEQKLAYKCYCDKETLDQKRETQLANKEKPRYDRTCLKLENEPDKPYVVRIKMPDWGGIAFKDKVMGRTNVRFSELTDTILQRSDGSVTFLFANMLDDCLTKVTDVIRGADGLSHSNYQIYMCEALGFPVPNYGHLPFVLNSEGNKLSKRNGDDSILDLREKGFLAEAVINTICRIGWSNNNEEIFSMDDLISKFDLKNVGKSPGIFDPQKLLNINKHWIKNSEPDKLQTLLEPFLLKEQITPHQIAEFNKVSSVSKAIKTLQTRSATLVEMAQKAKFYFIRPDHSTISLTGVQKEILKSFIDNLNSNNSIDEAIEETCRQVNCTIKELGPPVRLSLSGSLAAPGIVEIIEVLGTKEAIERIKSVIT